ncbi:DUF938 domain-containing protein [Methylocystis silviterrae]|uniref:DUF938 domain-containing protein n=1 Tax=Methylocystis silviterrae TaxID=2743612 RepID=UPI003C73037B
MNDKRLFAQHSPALTFCPSEPSGEARESISAWTSSMELANVGAPLALKVEQIPWPIRAADAIICINMTHIPPGARQRLCSSARSGPCPRERRSIYTVHTGAAARIASRRAEFDASLPARNAAWGVRDLEDVAARAREKGLESLKSWTCPSWTCPPAISASSFIAHDETSMHTLLPRERHGH